MAPTTSVKTLLGHPKLTTMGLFFEANAGILATVGPQLDAVHGLSGQRFEVLLRLVRTPGHRLRMTDLAAQTTLSASGLTRVVDRLVAEGLVERATCPSDRRGSYAVLTSAGEARILAAIPDHLAQLADILERAFSQRELDQFSHLVRKLRDTVHPEAARGGTDCDEG